MIKRTLALILTVCILSLGMNVFAFSDVESGTEHGNAVERLVQYGILSGKGNNMFDPYAQLTRAEIAKISTIMNGYDNLSELNTETTVFSDMPSSHWAGRYINQASKSQILMGYLDGTFAPDNYISYAESVTVLLRLLGYSSETLGDNWPDAYLAKAADLGLTDGMNYASNAAISRIDFALIADRALMADMNGTSGKLVEKMNYSVTDECIVLASKSENNTLLADQILTTIGTYSKADDFIDAYVTQKVRLVLDENKRIVNAIPASQNSYKIVSNGIAGNGILYTENGVSKTLKVDSSTVVYYDGEKYVFSGIKQSLESGATITVYYTESGACDYLVVNTNDLLGPSVCYQRVTASASKIADFTLNKNGLRVIRDGYEVSLDEIEKYDVLYYNTVSNVLYAYVDKISGVYEEALPNKSAVTQIVLSGKTYNIETEDALRRLGDYNGAYDINDSFTVLLGKDGDIAAVVDMNAADITNYGIITGYEQRNSENDDNLGSIEKYVTVLTVNGETQEFLTNTNYSEKIGNLVEYKFSADGIFSANTLNTTSISGTIDKSNEKIGEYWLAHDCHIIDVAYADGSTVIAKEIDFSEITLTSLTKNDVIHAEIDHSFGDIQFLILNDVTMSNYDIGVVTTKKDNSFTLNIKGAEYSYNNKYSAAETGAPVMVLRSNNSLVKLKALTKVSTSGTYGGIDSKRIKIGTKNYALGSNVAIYQKSYNEYKYVSFTEFQKLTSVSNVKIYCDNSLNNGGVVRVIVYDK